MRLRHLGICSLAALLMVSSARPWSAPTHREVGLLALERLPADARPTTREERQAFRRGTVAPDRRGQPGWIPPRQHVLHRGDPARRSAEEPVQQLEAWLRRRTLRRDPEWWFQAGRLAHLVADLCLPLHTASHPEEGRVHSPFERRVAALPWEAGAFREEGVLGPPTPLRRLAAVGRRSYPALLQDLLAHDESPSLERRARLWRRRAVREVAARLGALGGEHREEAEGGLAYLGWVLAWWLLLRRRSRET